MKTALCRKLGIEFPLFAFSHCRDVVAEVTNAGGFGVLGAVGHTPESLEVDLNWIDSRVKGRPYGIDLLIPNKMEDKQGELDLTLEEIRARLKSEKWLKTGTASVYERRDITFKKTLHAAEQDRPDVAARAELKVEQSRLVASRLVFIDETAVTTKMVRHRGRSPRGERLVASVPRRSPHLRQDVGFEQEVQRPRHEACRTDAPSLDRRRAAAMREGFGQGSFADGLARPSLG